MVSIHWRNKTVRFVKSSMPRFWEPLQKLKTLFWFFKCHKLSQYTVYRVNEIKGSGPCPISLCKVLVYSLKPRTSWVKGGWALGASMRREHQGSTFSGGGGRGGGGNSYCRRRKWQAQRSVFPEF